jgi:hypothetical protein
VIVGIAMLTWCAVVLTDAYVSQRIARQSLDTDHVGQARDHAVEREGVRTGAKFFAVGELRRTQCDTRGSESSGAIDVSLAMLLHGSTARGAYESRSSSNCMASRGECSGTDGHYHLRARER